MAIGNWGISGNSGSYPYVDYNSGELFGGPFGPCNGGGDFSIIVSGDNGSVLTEKTYGDCGCDDNLVGWFSGYSGTIRIAGNGIKTTSAGTWNYKNRVIDECKSILARSKDACESGECMFHHSINFSNYIVNGSNVCYGTITGNTSWPLDGTNEYKSITVTGATHVVRYCLYEGDYCFINSISNSSNLVGLYIPKSVKYINGGAFSGNTGLSKVFLRSDNELITIGDNAFSGNEKMDIIMVDTNYTPKPPLTGITISSSKLNSISQTAFKGVNLTSREMDISGCTSLKDVVLFETASNISKLRLPQSVSGVTITDNSSKIFELYLPYNNGLVNLTHIGQSLHQQWITTLYVPDKSVYEGTTWDGVATNIVNIT